MTNLTILLALAFAIGLVSGGGYFGGLWWTVRRLPQARYAWGLYFGSLLVRLAAALLCLFLLLKLGGWSALAAGLLGFVAMRQLLLCWAVRALPAAPATTQPDE